MPPTISQGSTGPAVSEAQYLLARRLILTATDIDGIFGPKTDQAVREFQGSDGLTVDGIVGPITWGALFTGYAIPPTLKKGSRGPVVERLQQALNTWMAQYTPATPALVLDGIFGPLTQAAVKAFQTWAGVPVDGVVGLQTWAVGLHAAGEELASVVGV